jgi:hypothetical protein
VCALREQCHLRKKREQDSGTAHNFLLTWHFDACTEARPHLAWQELEHFEMSRFLLMLAVAALIAVIVPTLLARSVPFFGTNCSGIKSLPSLWSSVRSGQGTFAGKKSDLGGQPIAQKTVSVWRRPSIISR